ncbi:hypothetical protein HYT91_00290 [Candidatus Pacearchaeota archaeon]|nr:hypothetical protein [Candidatus Pacearchaeota archaeon]
MKTLIFILIVLILSLNFVNSYPYPTKDISPYPIGNEEIYPIKKMSYPQEEDNLDGNPYPTNEITYPIQEENKDGNPYPIKNESSQQKEFNMLSKSFKYIKKFFANLFR